MNTILQWNCRGLISNIDDIHDLFDRYNAACFCLQETYLTIQITNISRRANIFRKDRIGAARASGGVAILTSKSIPAKGIPLMTDLEAVAVQICLEQVITVCSLYLSPSAEVQQSQLEILINQLPPPFLILGDFNAHNSLWGSVRTDSRGKMVESVLISRPICLLNAGNATHINAATQRFSAIDLSICSPSLYQHVTWTVDENPYGSDHFPVIIKLYTVAENFSTRPPRWKLANARWDLFETKANLLQLVTKNTSIEDTNKVIVETILDAAIESIPQTSGHLPKRPKPWWTDECRETRKRQNKAWGIFKRYPTPGNLLAFKKARAKARWTRRQAKRESWKKFISSLSCNTSSKQVWDRLKKIKGEYSILSIPLLEVNGTPCQSLEEQANALGEHFQNVSSSSHYSKQFLKTKVLAEKHKLSPMGDEDCMYNAPFTMVELARALLVPRITTPGPDRITYSMLQHLSQSSQGQLLHFFNQVWEEGRLPSQWKTATIIPLLKPGKDPSSCSSYRPIALTSCLGKIFERLVNNRLMYYIEENGCLDQYQCGFRAARSTVDHLVRLETAIREAFVRRQHCVSVFFDLEKAYDTTWRYGILRDLYSYGIRGRLFCCIADFLQGRTFRVQLGGILSRLFIQENGVPQGSVLSVTLFIVKMNSVATAIPPSVTYSLYVDDIQISYSSANLPSCERQLQLTIHRLVKWSHENGFTFSPEKTVCVPFTRVRGIHPDPALKISGQDLVVKSEHKFLGLIFDRTLTFSSHIKNLKVKCIKSLNLLKILSHRSWGADRETLHRVYASIIRSRLDYGCMVYGSARPSTLKCLNSVHHQGLRLVSGAFRTSPVESLYVECNEWALERRRFYLSVLYALRVRSFPQHPVFPVVNQMRFRQLFLNKPSVVPPFSMRIIQQIKLFGFEQYFSQIFESSTRIPPWQPAVKHNISLTRYNKHDTPNVVLQQEFDNLRESFGDHAEFYTDGSKTTTSVSCAMVTQTITKSHRLNQSASIFSAELYAVILALNYILQNHVKSSVIYTDSLSALQAVCNFKHTKNLLVQRARCLACAVANKGYTAILSWVPSHVGIPGNERADQAATIALAAEVTPVGVAFQDLKSVLKSTINSHWQEFWERQSANKLQLIKPKIGKYLMPSGNRLEEVLLCRLRVGHTLLTHGFLLGGEEPPQCRHCKCQLSILHILISCPLHERRRQQHFSVFYKYFLPLHPALLLGDDSLVPFANVVNFFRATGHIGAL